MKKVIIIILTILSLGCVSEKDDTKNTKKLDKNQKVIKGSNFGSGPTVVLFDSFQNNKANELIDLEGSEIGKWKEYNGTTYGNTKKAFAWYEDERYWLANRDPNRLEEDSSNLSSISYEHDKKMTEFLFAFRWKIAKGYKFPGASTVNTVDNIASNHKMNWFWDKEDGELGGDVVIPTFGSANSCWVSGNGVAPKSQGAKNFYFNHSKITANTDNFFLYYQKSGEEGKWNGTMEISQHSSKFHYTKLENDCEVFNRNSGDAVLDGYNKIAVNAWQGNVDSFINVLLLYGDIYLSVGENSRARIYTHDKETLADSENVYIIPPDSWTENEIRFTPKDYEDLGYYSIILSNGDLLENRVLSN